MTSRFYTNVLLHRGNIHHIGYKDGKRIMEKIPCQPYLFIPSKNDNSQYKTLKGKKVDKVNFDTPTEAREFMERYKEVANFPVYGMTNFVYPWINDYYPGEVDYNASQINVANFDIETIVQKGKLVPAEAKTEITAITIEMRDVITVFGCKEYHPTLPNVTYIRAKDEEEMLLKFLEYWDGMRADVLTGFNIEAFDIPYLYNRCIKILSPELAKKLSPWRIINEREIVDRFGSRVVYDIAGISVLDYMQLYKKFSFKMQESYSLNHICSQELGEQKLSYSEFKGLNDLYEKDFKKYIDYNIRDVILVKKLDNKLKLIEQVFAIAFDGKVNFIDALTSVRMWDVIIHNHLINKNIVVPQMKSNKKDGQIVGAYVKEPEAGLYKWVVSYDLASLYPHLIMQYNISPETLVGHFGEDVDVGRFLSSGLQPHKQEIVDSNQCVAASGYKFDRDYQGFLPALMEKMYNDRSVWKKKMLEYERELESVEQELKKRGVVDK